MALLRRRSFRTSRREVQELDIVMVRGGLGVMETIPISNIRGLIGCIKSSDERGKVVYLTSNRTRECE